MIRTRSESDDFEADVRFAAIGERVEMLDHFERLRADRPGAAEYDNAFVRRWQRLGLISVHSKILGPVQSSLLDAELGELARGECSARVGVQTSTLLRP